MTFLNAKSQHVACFTCYFIENDMLTVVNNNVHCMQSKVFTLTHDLVSLACFSVNVQERRVYIICIIYHACTLMMIIQTNMQYAIPTTAQWCLRSKGNTIRISIIKNIKDMSCLILSLKCLIIHVHLLYVWQLNNIEVLNTN